MKLLLSSLCQQNIPHLPVLRPRHRRHVLLYIDSSSSGPSIYATLLCLCRVAWKKPNDFGYGTKFSGLFHYFHFTTCMLMNFITVNNSSLQYWHVVTFRYTLFRFITLRYNSKPFEKIATFHYMTWRCIHACQHSCIWFKHMFKQHMHTCIHTRIHTKKQAFTHTSIPPRWKQWKGCAPQNACQNRAKQTHTHTQRNLLHTLPK